MGNKPSSTAPKDEKKEVKLLAKKWEKKKKDFDSLVTLFLPATFADSAKRVEFIGALQKHAHVAASNEPGTLAYMAGVGDKKLPLKDGEEEKDQKMEQHACLLEFHGDYDALLRRLDHLHRSGDAAKSVFSTPASQPVRPWVASVKGFSEDEHKYLRTHMKDARLLKPLKDAFVPLRLGDKATGKAMANDIVEVLAMVYAKDEAEKREEAIDALKALCKQGVAEVDSLLAMSCYVQAAADEDADELLLLVVTLYASPSKCTAVLNVLDDAAEEKLAKNKAQIALHYMIDASDKVAEAIGDESAVYTKLAAGFKPLNKAHAKADTHYKLPQSAAAVAKDATNVAAAASAAAASETVDNGSADGKDEKAAAQTTAEKKDEPAAAAAAPAAAEKDDQKKEEPAAAAPAAAEEAKPQGDGAAAAAAAASTDAPAAAEDKPAAVEAATTAAATGDAAAAAAGDGEAAAAAADDAAAKGMSEEEFSKRVHNIFRSYDVDGNGQLSAIELLNFVQPFSPDVQVSTLYKTIGLHDDDGDKLLNVDEFAKYMFATFGELTEGKMAEALDKAEKSVPDRAKLESGRLDDAEFDDNVKTLHEYFSNDGLMNGPELMMVICVYDPTLDASSITTIIDEFDLDKDGALNHDEFAAYMKKTFRDVPADKMRNLFKEVMEQKSWKERDANEAAIPVDEQYFKDKVGELFDRANRNDDDMLGVFELVPVCIGFVPDINEDNFFEKFNASDKNKDSKLSKDEFGEFLHGTFSKVGRDKFDEMVAKAFDHLPKEEKAAEGAADGEEKKAEE